MLELVVRSRLGRDGLIRTSSSLVIHIIFVKFYYIFESYLLKYKSYNLYFLFLNCQINYKIIIYNLYIVYKIFKGRYSSKVEQLYVAQLIPVQLRISSLLYFLVKLG